MSIAVKHLTKVFGQQKAVNDISFTIEPGNVVGFLGPNGAGKSTTMKILSGFLIPTSGQAFVAGYNVESDPLRVKQNLGYLPEKNPLYHDLYVKEYLDFTAQIHHLGKQRKQRVAEIIELTGLGKEVKKKIGALSKGYKQRVGLAQALIHKPKVLILDEPTSGLDPNQILAIRELIKNVSQETTVLLSTHIMQEVQAMCNRVIIINEGQIVADDRIENLGQGDSIFQENSLLVEWEERLQNTEFESFKHLQSVESLGNNTWRFKSQAVNELRIEIMKWSLEKGYNILSLRKEGQSLENTFHKLTRKKPSQTPKT